MFERIANFQALCEAAQRAAKSKRRKPGVAGFLANLERNVLRLERELLDGTWRPGNYTVIEVRDPKPRRVSAAPFRDRVVHHALCAVVEPVLSRGFIPDSYANRTGKGTHRAIARYEQYRDRHAWCLRCDIFRYFPAIDHAILKTDLRRRIHCERTLALLGSIITGDPWWQLEQQTAEPAVRQPQQEHTWQPQQQLGFSSCQHALLGRNRRGQGCTGCADERPKPVMVSAGPAAVLAHTGDSRRCSCCITA